ncbi:preprotein translocase subunit SecY [Rubrobacter taiwanensis]|jgi:preprotein translocase subunit SecY|uniref:Protein translocase subunit SecY n=1 Tax=Rubrobacter taiwanensis TaxID=185139 RepID=A0A4R1BLV2_9ACTN|nr:preprotein translocase subunit SecY [Rubrobacter taiwanensis]TCJ18258.1 preprotein translocase subunit SecY [Rubrobacter taiwanensis]
MIDALANAWRVPELRRKLFFTVGMLALYRLGAYIPLPGVNREFLAAGGVDTGENAITGLVGIFTGGAFNNLSIFALGIMPYITAAITMQLLTVAIPRLQQLAREGETGQKKITQYTRYFTLGLSFIQSVSVVMLFRSGALGGGVLANSTPLDLYLIVLTLTTGTMLIMWMGELISQYGIGNGISLIITAAIISQAPNGIRTLFEGGNVLTIVIIGLLALLIITAIVFVNEGQRRIPISYAKRQVGRRMTQGGTTYLPMKVNMAGVIPIIFASSLLIFPTAILQFAGGDPDSFLVRFAQFFAPGELPYLVLFAILIVLFTYFYTAVQFNPIEHADNLKKTGGYIPGIRPGQPTAIYMNNVLTRITLFGALFLAAVAVVPYVITGFMNVQIFLGGTSMLIVVGVALDFVRQLESQLMMRNYEGFLRKQRI